MTDVTGSESQVQGELSAADEQLLRELTERARTASTPHWPASPRCQMTGWRSSARR